MGERVRGFERSSKASRNNCRKSRSAVMEAPAAKADATGDSPAHANLAFPRLEVLRLSRVTQRIRSLVAELGDS